MLAHAVARSLVATVVPGQGAKVTLHYNGNSQPAQALAAQHPGRACSVQASLEDEASTQHAMADAVAALGPIHVLVVNHGVWPTEDVLLKVRHRTAVFSLGSDG